MSDEILPKSLQDPIPPNPRLNENISTALDMKAEDKINRRSPVIIKAYESMDQNPRLRLYQDHNSLNIDNSHLNSQDMVHVLSGNELLSQQGDNRGHVKVSINNLDRGQVQTVSRNCATA